MAMTVKKSADVLAKTVFVSNKGKVADMPNGVNVKVSDLVNGSTLQDGTPIGAAVSGISPVLKMGKALTGSTTTAIKVESATNQFKVGDPVFSLLNGKHYAITTVSDPADGVTTLTVGTAIDAPLDNGGFIFQGADVADAATGAALLVSPVAITGSNWYVDTTTNLHMDAWVQAAVKSGSIGDIALDALVANRAYISEV